MNQNKVWSKAEVDTISQIVQYNIMKRDTECDIYVDIDNTKDRQVQSLEG